jgi:hypothetical protein
LSKFSKILLFIYIYIYTIFFLKKDSYMGIDSFEVKNMLTDSFWSQFSLFFWDTDSNPVLALSNCAWIACMTFFIIKLRGSSFCWLCFDSISLITFSYEYTIIYGKKLFVRAICQLAASYLNWHFLKFMGIIIKVIKTQKWYHKNTIGGGRAHSLAKWKVVVPSPRPWGWFGHLL